jgi:hypothetical protein
MPTPGVTQSWIWLLYVAVLLLCLGVAATVHIQFSRNVHRREGIAALMLLSVGAIFAIIGFACSPL